MRATRGGFESPKTLRSKVDRFKARTPQGALLELTRLTQEKMRLREELDRWQQRILEIRGRLEEIADLEAWLYRFVEPPTQPGAKEAPQPEADQAAPPPAPPEVREVTIRY